ncbi:hypothetical protein HaLaN_17205, partial [Haematococcus lacustris]
MRTRQWPGGHLRQQQWQIALHPAHNLKHTTMPKWHSHQSAQHVSSRKSTGFQCGHKYTWQGRCAATALPAQLRPATVQTGPSGSRRAPSRQLPMWLAW